MYIEDSGRERCLANFWGEVTEKLSNTQFRDLENNDQKHVSVFKGMKVLDTKMNIHLGWDRTYKFSEGWKMVGI